MARLSLRARLAFWNIVLLMLAVLAMGAALHIRMRESLLHNIDSQLDDRVHGFEAFTDLRVKGSPKPTVSSQHRSAGAIVQIPAEEAQRKSVELHFREPRLTPVDGRTPLLFDAKPPWNLEMYRESLNGQRVYSTVVAEGRSIRVLSLPLPKTGPMQAVLQVAQPLEDTANELHRLLTSMLKLVPIAIAAIAVVGLLLVRVALTPVKDLAARINRIQPDDLTSRLDVTGKDEFANLTATINGLLERLGFAFQAQDAAIRHLRRFTADAGHELRTPLTAIKASSTIALRAANKIESEAEREAQKTALQIIDRSADRMSRLVSDLLLLARHDAGQTRYELAPIPVADLIDVASDGLDRAGIAFSISVVPDDLCLVGDAFSLERALSNLIANAMRHARSKVHVAGTAKGDKIAIEITDDGPGIAPEHLAHLGERFYRVDPSREREGGGTGLGLAIAKSIVEDHGGSLSIESTVDKGATVRISLPSH